jgi:tRNA-dihydrouridine synthase B
MASASALFYQPKKTLELLKFHKTERPYVVQLFGADPVHFAKAAKIVTHKIKPDGIDINFGCPAKKVIKIGAGCALMANKKLARKIIQTVIKNTHLPVSIKIRSGYKEMKAINFIKHIKDLQFQAVMVHGRTYENGFSGPVDFSIIENIKEIVSDKIVLANGGINSPEDALQILREHSLLDGLGIARGALGRPYIFRQINDLTKNGKYSAYPFSEIKKIMIKHAEYIWKEKKSAGITEMRKHRIWYVKGLPGASVLRQKLVQAKSLKDIKNILEHKF